jgi:hypothetical protein
MFARPKAQQRIDARAFRCGTPHLQSGGIVLLHTDNLVEILRGEPASEARLAEHG